MRARFLSLMIFVCVLAIPGIASAGLFGKNSADDTFSVKSIDGKQAIVEGKPKNLKVGDVLYTVRPPYKFTVTEVKGNQVTIALPEKHDLTPGIGLLRNSNDQIDKNIKTQDRLKDALE